MDPECSSMPRKLRCPYCDHRDFMAGDSFALHLQTEHGVPKMEAEQFFDLLKKYALER
jgi:organic radical activating enzyme